MSNAAPPNGTDPLVAAIVAEADKSDYALTEARVAHWRKQLAQYPKRQIAGATLVKLARQLLEGGHEKAAHLFKEIAAAALDDARRAGSSYEDAARQAKEVKKLTTVVRRGGTSPTSGLASAAAKARARSGIGVSNAAKSLARVSDRSDNKK
jgi:hypothetical protein